MITAKIVNQTVEYDLYFIVFGDVLMFVVSTVFSEEGEAVDILLELLLLCG